MSDKISLIPLEEARRVEGGLGRTSQYRTRKLDPSYPKVLYRGGRAFLVEHEHQEWLKALIARLRGEAEERDRQREDGAKPAARQSA